MRVMVITLLCMWLGISNIAEACTLYGAAGSSVSGSGTLLAKNRDWRPDHTQFLRVVKPERGYAYLALATTGGFLKGNKAGVNEKGLAVISASPPSHYENEGFFKGGTVGMSYVLSRYQSVAEAVEALQSERWIAGPQAYMMSDGTEIAYIEFGPDRSFAVRRESSGLLAHTNHYLEPALVHFNPDKTGSSKPRLERALSLLAAKPVLDSYDFQAIAADNVLWRNPANPLATRTLASFQVYTEPGGKVNIWARIANPGQAAYELSFALRDALDGRVSFNKENT